MSARETIDILDDHNNGKRVGQIRWREGEGQLQIEDPVFEGLLRRLFTEPRSAGRRGFIAEDGVRGAAVERTLEPWTQEAVDHALQVELPKRRLRGSKR